jgi:hypothetical protein
MSNLRHIGIGQELVKAIIANNGLRPTQVTKQVDLTTMKTVKDEPVHPSKFSARPTQQK